MKRWMVLVMMVSTLSSIAKIAAGRADLRSRPPAVRMIPVGRAKLCITEGALEEHSGGRLTVTVAKMRAFVTGVTGPTVEARFTYLGPTTEQARLGSGALRRQIGLKLRAQDGCNVVYAMWRLNPESKLVVSVKRNPGMTMSAECGNRGYRNIKPRRASVVPRLKAGDAHTLRAEMNGSEMQVLVDGGVVWEGGLGEDIFSFNGPVGLRTDNGRFALKLFASEPGQIAARLPCRAGDKEE